MSSVDETSLEEDEVQMVYPLKRQTKLAQGLYLLEAGGRIEDTPQATWTIQDKARSEWCWIEQLCKKSDHYPYEDEDDGPICF
jgi:hypothetical protein